MKTKISYKQYRADSTNLHQAYYGQFVTDDIKQMVLNRFSKSKLVKSFAADENLNNLPLYIWDGMAGGYQSQLCADELRATGNGPSLCSGVCILKAAARMIAQEK